MSAQCARCGHAPEFFGDKYCDYCAADIQDKAIPTPKRRNYIDILREQVYQRDARIEDLESQIEEIVKYLSLDKFSVDTSVSKYDILRMLGRY